LYIHGNAIGQAHNLIEFSTDQENGTAVVARFDNPAMMIRCSLHPAARRLLASKNLIGRAKLPRRDDLLADFRLRANRHSFDTGRVES